MSDFLDLDDDKQDKSDGKKKDPKTYIYIGVAVGGLVISYLIYKKMGESSAPAASSGGSSAPASAPVVYTSGGGGSGAQSAASAAAIAQIEQQLAGMTASTGGTGNSQLTSSVSSQTTPTTSTTSTSTASTTASTQSNLPPIVNTALGQMYVLGPGADAYTSDYQVYGGAPVYYGNASQLAQGQTDNGPGAYAYTPIQYGSLIYGHGIPAPN
jgi:hypothetical protein